LGRGTSERRISLFTFVPFKVAEKEAKQAQLVGPFIWAAWGDSDSGGAAYGVHDRMKVPDLQYIAPIED